MSDESKRSPATDGLTPTQSPDLIIMESVCDYFNLDKQNSFG